MLQRIFIIISICILYSCNRSETFKISEFNPVSNFHDVSDTVSINMDLSNAIINGIEIPSNNDTEEFFKIKFKIKNTSGVPRRYYYKVCYQNESYKFIEYTGEDVFTRFNKKAIHNFYGSWLGSDIGFHVTGIIPADKEYYEIIDSIRIVGNPRNENRYFGGNPTNKAVSEEEIDKMIQGIRKNDKWFSKIKEKAKNNNVSVDDQLQLDARWIIRQDRRKGDVNNRWKRNPRTGNYKFLLAVCDEENIIKIPDYIKDITKKDTVTNNFINPYFYFLHKYNPEAKFKAIVSDKILKTKAVLDPLKGIYINHLKLKEETEGFDTNAFVGFSDQLFTKAHFEQFFHHINYNFNLNNIPLSYDVIGDNYTQKLYHENAKKYTESELLKDYMRISKNPGKTVGYDSTHNSIFIKNPGRENTNELRKENVGVNTRIGFTYGKYRAKIIFPEIISKDYVWNGLTCAFWLLFQDNAEWNNRCKCEKGYIPKYLRGKVEDEKRVKYNYYSEIDIEIVKTSKYWTQSSYGMKKNYPKDNGLNNNVMVTCTNWDLACTDPVNFDKGVKSITYNYNEYKIHRWDQWYKALTIKHEHPQPTSLGKVIYYEIDWQPDKIIWRIGEDKDHMQMIAYMDETCTKIPDNQMVAVITQEFHDATWWPTAPFDQNKVPYPEKDIKGYIYEIEVE